MRLSFWGEESYYFLKLSDDFLQMDDKNEQNNTIDWTKAWEKFIENSNHLATSLIALATA